MAASSQVGANNSTSWKAWTAEQLHCSEITHENKAAETAHTPTPSSSREVDEANALAQTVFLEEEEELYWTEELVDGQGP